MPDSNSFTRSQPQVIFLSPLRGCANGQPRSGDSPATTGPLLPLLSFLTGASIRACG